MIPSYSRKAISGQNNYLGTVISHMMSENEMGYRGSKSKLNQVVQGDFVKEQRVDGSWSNKAITNKLLLLRCTLTGFERNYPFKIPSKQLNKKLFSTFAYLNPKPHLSTPKPPVNFYKNQRLACGLGAGVVNWVRGIGCVAAAAKISPWFLTGFTDAEGCFSIKIQSNDKLKNKWRVRPAFSITLHIKDQSLLESIKNSLGVGNISKSGKKAVTYAVDSIKEIPVIINHFDKYPLITQKFLDYSIFKECFEIIKQGKHLTESGLLEIIALKSNLNLGLSLKLKEAFSKKIINYPCPALPCLPLPLSQRL